MGGRVGENDGGGREREETTAVLSGSRLSGS